MAVRAAGKVNVVLCTVVMGIVVALALMGCSASQPTSSSASAASRSASASASSSAAASSAAGGKSAGSVTMNLDYHAGTGYEWTYEVEPDGVLEFVDQTTENLAAENVAGGALQDHFTFEAVSSGEAVVTFNLVRAWETDVEPAETQVYAFTVGDDGIILNPYKSNFDNEPQID